MKKTSCLYLIILVSTYVYSQGNLTNTIKSGNPIIPGWYADPEGRIFGDQYWIYPTYSDDSDEDGEDEENDEEDDSEE